MLKEEGSDLKACDGHTIKNFFEQLGLKSAFTFDQAIVDAVKKDIPAQKYESMTQHDLF